MLPKSRIIPVFIPHAGCPHNCAFCSQKTIAGKENPTRPEEIKEIIREAAKYAGGGAELAYYGGSFTAIDKELQEAYLIAAKEFIDNGTLSGIRVSTRPDAIDDDILDMLRRYSVHTIELGAQSMRDEVLEANTRGHSSHDTMRASAMIKDAGFTLGLQMMTGLYKDDDAGALYTAEKFTEIRPDIVRIYPTVVLGGTALEKLYNDGKYRPQTVSEAVKLCAMLYMIFSECEIAVIRMGLNTSEKLGSEAIAGPYHPAFGELVFSEIYRKKAMAKLSQYDCKNKSILLCVPNGDISKMTGQKRCNIDLIKSETGASRITVAAEGGADRAKNDIEVHLCI